MDVGEATRLQKDFQGRACNTKERSLNRANWRSLCPAVRLASGELPHLRALNYLLPNLAVMCIIRGSFLRFSCVDHPTKAPIRWRALLLPCLLVIPYYTSFKHI